MTLQTLPKASSTRRKPIKRFASTIACVTLGIGVALCVLHRHDPRFAGAALSQVPGVRNFVSVAPAARPYGMAPQAFNALLRACRRVGFHPYRIGQTIGNHPRSVGYHQRDGVLVINNQPIDYCAAVDLGAQDMNNAQIQRFLAVLNDEGFAAWYRSGPNWKGGEHIHAIYGSLQMKPQLEGQVRDFLRERRRKRLPRPRWERTFRRLN